MIADVEHTQLALDVIRTDGGTQPRAELNQDTVQDYAQSMMEGVTFPPVVVFYDGADYWLADGFHRYHANKQICLESINAEVRQGTRRDAVLYSVGANASHGLRRTNADKRRAVETLLRDEEWVKWNDSEIARHTATSHDFVRRLRPLSILHSMQDTERIVTRNGLTYTMNTANIGTRQVLITDFTPPSIEIGGKEEEDAFRPRYNHSKPAYCKYCYQTHNDWELSGDHGGIVWICQECDHATGDEFMQIEDAEPSQEQKAFYEERREVFPGWKLPVNSPPPSTWGFVDGKPFTAPLPDGKPIEIPEDWKLPPGMRGDAPIKSTTLSALQSSESAEWYTPAQYSDAARRLMGGIDLDPASCELANQTIKAKKFYTKKDNGLFQPWYGRVWLNPPYGFDGGSSNQEVWTRQLIERYTAGLVAEAVLLVNANTEAKWFQPLYDYLICFTDHRIRFYNGNGNSSQPTQGNALVYFGKQEKQEQRFIELFSPFGTVVRRAK